MKERIEKMANAAMTLRSQNARYDEAVHEILSEYKLCHALLVEMNDYLNINKLTSIAHGSIFHTMIQARLK
jgi:hypothetical protein